MQWCEKGQVKTRQDMAEEQAHELKCSLERLEGNVHKLYTVVDKLDDRTVMLAVELGDQIARLSTAVDKLTQDVDELKLKLKCAQQKETRPAV